MKTEKITPDKLAELPPDVQKALKEAQALLAEKARGRCTMPKPSLLTYPLEEGEAPLYAVALPIAFHQVEAIEEAGKKGGLVAMATVLAESCFWVQGMPEPEPGQDPRKVAAAYLKEMEKVPGPLGLARVQLAGAILEMLAETPEVSAGKL